jgi:hypothetical protein
MAMSAGIMRPMLVAGILLAAGSYAATKEWQEPTESDVLAVTPIAQVERIEVSSADGIWPMDAVTVQPEQIFED